MLGGECRRRFVIRMSEGEEVDGGEEVEEVRRWIKLRWQINRRRRVQVRRWVEMSKMDDRG